jgi:FAD linked oxidases, C-terminal domain.
VGDSRIQPRRPPHVPGEPLNWEGWEDAAVVPEKLGAYLRDLRKMMADFGYKGSLYGHFGHACVHTRLNFDLQSKEASPSTAASLKKLPTSLSAMADRSPANTAMVKPAPNSSQKCSGPS